MTARKTANYGLLIALAMILSYLESMVPVSIGVPGVKMGLPNIVIVFALYTMGFKAACIISLIRIVLVSILFGNLFAMVYSIAGAVFSLGVMYLLRRSGKFSAVGVSVSGGVMHNVGQIMVAVAVLETAGIAYYLPVLCISGVAAGVCVGILSSIIIKRLANGKKGH